MQVDKISREYHVKSYECDRNGTLRLLTLMNIFQDTADTHASLLGVGIEHCLAHGLAWVGSNYQIEIERMPAWHEKITVESWPAAEKKLGAVRDFVIRDEKGMPIIRSSSQWVLIDFVKKRPVSLRDNLPQYRVIDERALETDFARLPEPAREDHREIFKVRYDDIDVNHHVNNAVYPLWATEAVPADFRLKHTPAALEIAFKKEGLFGEEVVIRTEIDGLVTLHGIYADDDNRELAKIRIRWK